MATCCICGKSTGLKKVMIKDMKYLCFDCVKAAGFQPLTWTGNMKTSEQDIRKLLRAPKSSISDYAKGSLHASAPEKCQIKFTRTVGNYFKMDEVNRVWYGQDIYGMKPTKVHSFDDVISYELLEDGEAITKGGLGSAMAGGLAFGLAGATVGAMTGKRKTSGRCTSMKIKISLNDLSTPVEYIELLNMKVSRNSAAYKKAFDAAQEILAIMQIMTTDHSAPSGDSRSFSNESASSKSVADEIREFKALMDDGIISEEEFEAKKRQLLGL